MNMFNFWFKTQLYHPCTYTLWSHWENCLLYPLNPILQCFYLICCHNNRQPLYLFSPKNPRQLHHRHIVLWPTDRFAAIFNGARFRLRRYRSIRLFSNELASEICDSFWNQHLLFVLSQMCICQFDLKYMLQSLNIIKWFVYSDDMVDVALEMEQQAKGAAQFSEAHAANFPTLSTL